MGAKDGGKKPGSGFDNYYKSLIIYMVVMLVVTILLNGLIVPSMTKRQIIEVGYNDFLDMVESGQVERVQKDTEEILFLAKDERGNEQVYKTGLWDDPDLTSRLRDADVPFGEVIVEQESAIMAFFTNWILPIAVMVIFWQLLTRMMTKRMGGNAMTFGKANAKIYAENETGVTFADVAGEEEAKEALKEIVDFLHEPKKYSDIGATLPKGALLVGPPGTGKTLLAKAVPGKPMCPFSRSPVPSL